MKAPSPFLSRMLLCAVAVALLSLAAEAQVAPIKIPPTSKGARDFTAAQDAWAEHALIAPFRERAAGKPWLEPACDFARQAMHEWPGPTHGEGNGKLPPLSRIGQNLIASGAEDPLITYFTAWTRWKASEENYGSREAFNKARKAAEQLPGQGALAWMATLDFLRANHIVKQGAEDAPKKAVALAVTMWTDGSYRPEDDFIYLRHVKSWLWEDNFEKKTGPVVVALQKVELPPWVRETLVGQAEIDRAWESRGGDFADKVTQEGWKGFAEHLEKAKRHLTHAWQLRKDRPEAASLMITVAMGGGSEEKQDPRFWFDRAISAECDYEPAYLALYNARQARWGGSNDEIIALGERCLETHRFDTGVPLKLLRAIWYVNSNLDDTTHYGDFRETLLEQDLGIELSQCLHGYANEPSRRGERRIWLAQAALYEWLCGDAASAARTLAECGPEPLPFEVRHFLPRLCEDENSFRGEVAILTSPAREAYLEAKVLRANESYPQAAEAFAKAAKLAPGLAADRLRALSAVSEVEAKLAAGEWATIPPDPTLQSWLQRSGLWSATPEGYPTLTDGDGPVRIAYAARVGREFELRATLDLSGEPKAKWFTGVFFGDHSLGGYEPNWRGGFVRIDKGKTIGSARFFVKDYVIAGRAVDCPLRPHNEITMRYESGNATWTFNGVPIQKNEKIGGLNHFGMVGFGSYRHTAGVTIGLSKLEIRRLDKAPPSLEKRPE